MAETDSRVTQAMLDLMIQIRIFDELDSDELRVVSKLMNFVDVEKGTVVFREGKTGNYVCFVAEGELDVVKALPGGERMVLTTLQRGSSIGEMSLLDDLPRSATVIARTDATLLTMSSRAFQRIIDKYPAMAVKIVGGIARLLSQNLRFTSARLADYMLPVG